MTRRDERDTIKFSLRSHCDWEQAAGTETKHDRKEQWVVKHQNEFPRRLRTAIEAKSSKGLSSQAFLSQIKLEFEEWIFASIGTGTSAGTSAGVDTTDGTEPPRGGLNDRVDTEEEVELALRCFPEVLTSRRRGLYPIFWLSKSVHSVSFIPLFATLGEELGLFQEFERGGLVFGGNYITVFSQLAAGTSNAHHHHHHHHHDGTNDGTNDDNDLYHRYHRLVDDKFLAVLKRLRENKLMRRKDIRPNDLIGTLNQQVVFPEQRFRYLVDWDPRNTLLKTDGNALSWDLVSKYILDSEVLSPRYTQTQTHTQTHTVGNNNNNNNNNKDRVGTAGIEMLFELAVRYFPVEMGFLFHQYDVKRKRHQRGVDETNFHNRRCRKYTLSRGSSPPREEHNRTTPPSTTTTTTIATFTTRSTTTITTATTKKTIIAKTTTTITKTTTPYRIACEKFGIARVNAILQDALDRNAAINNNGRTEASSSTRSSSSSSSSSGTITKDCDCDCSALVYAASEQRVDLDCVYILLQRNPAFCKVQ